MDLFARATSTPLWDSAPPPPSGPDHNYPTLLFSWWCTGCAVFIIITRLIGRKIRSNKLFREDWIMMIALAPLLIRQGLIHVVLLYRTNNVQTVGYTFTAIDIAHRSIGSRLVLAARIFYALFIWISKLTVSEFLKRITVLSWRRSYEYTLRGIRIFLFVSFAAVVIATLTECQPFDHFWQVVPDPGHQCRTGYANLISMGACDILTDILLVAFPIPIVLRSGQTWKRKIQLAALFSLSLIPIAITATRVPEVILHRGRQQYRTVWASCEILASASVSNAVILGSFLRDKGTKRNKYRSHSVSDSIERSSVRRTPTTAHGRSNSEEDLFRSVGIRIPEHLKDDSGAMPRPAPTAIDERLHESRAERPELHNGEALPKQSDSDDSLDQPVDLRLPRSIPEEQPTRSMSFFDVGGLLLDDTDLIANHRYSGATTLVGSSHSNTAAQDFAVAPSSQTPAQHSSHVYPQETPTSSHLTTATSTNKHHQTQPFFSTHASHRHSDHSFPHWSDRYSRHHHQPAPTGIMGVMLERRETQQSLQDAGGLLDAIGFGDDDYLTSDAKRQRLQVGPYGEAIELPVRSNSEGRTADRHTQGPSHGTRGQAHRAQAGEDPGTSEVLTAAIASPSIARSEQVAGGRSTQHPTSAAATTSWEDMQLDDPGGLLR